MDLKVACKINTQHTRARTRREKEKERKCVCVRVCVYDRQTYRKTGRQRHTHTHTHTKELKKQTNSPGPDIMDLMVSDPIETLREMTNSNPSEETKTTCCRNVSESFGETFQK